MRGAQSRPPGAAGHARGARNVDSTEREYIERGVAEYRVWRDSDEGKAAQAETTRRLRDRRRYEALGRACEPILREASNGGGWWFGPRRSASLEAALAAFDAAQEG